MPWTVPESLAHLVHLETHFDRTEVHRHITVLVLTAEMLVITHVDDHQLDESGEQMVAQVSTESVPASQIKSVVLSYIYAQPQDYKPSDPARELTLSIAWSGGQRVEMGPTTCGDPNCDSDHGYSGTIAQEDIALRISAEAEGLQAVADAKSVCPGPARGQHRHGSARPMPGWEPPSSPPSAHGWAAHITAANAVAERSPAPPQRAWLQPARAAGGARSTGGPASAMFSPAQPLSWASPRSRMS